MLTKVRWCSKSSDMVGTRHKNKKMSEPRDDGGTSSRDASVGRLSGRSRPERLAIAPPKESVCVRRIEVDGRKRTREKRSKRMSCSNDEMAGLLHPRRFMCLLPPRRSPAGPSLP